MSKCIYNFNPGPAVMPPPVLEQIQSELLDYQGCGMSVMEVSHRSSQFDDIIESATARVKGLLGLSDDFTVMFMTGGASTQFTLVPMNLAAGMTPVYLNTGTWSAKAIKEAEIQGLSPVVAASSEDRNFSYIPTEYEIPANAAYLHFTTNNTIKGTQFHVMPQGDAPLIADMSSDIMSRPFDATRFGLFYAGAQKNLGPSGITLVVIRSDMLDRVGNGLPTIFKYTTMAQKKSLYNTAPTFPIYAVGLVLKWIEDQGGLDDMGQHNEKKAARLYGALDDSGGFFKPTAEVKDRSQMNVTFRLADEALEPIFIAEAAENGFHGLKGHRSVGGCRASIYNACPNQAIDDLVAFMGDFVRKNG